MTKLQTKLRSLTELVTDGLKRSLPTLCELGGFGLVAAAAWEVYHPAGLAVAGAGLVVVGFVTSKPAQ